MRPHDTDFCDLILRRLARADTCIVDMQQLHAGIGQRKANGADLALSVRGIDRADNRCFGLAVPLQNFDAGLLLKLLEQFDGQGRRTTNRIVQRRDIRINLTLVQCGKRRWNRHEEIDFIALDQLPEIINDPLTAKTSRRHQDQTAPIHGASQAHHIRTETVEQRQRAEDHIALGQHALFHCVANKDHAADFMRREFRITCRATGMEISRNALTPAFRNGEGQLIPRLARNRLIPLQDLFAVRGIHLWPDQRDQPRQRRGDIVAHIDFNHRLDGRGRFQRFGDILRDLSFRKAAQRHNDLRIGIAQDRRDLRRLQQRVDGIDNARGLRGKHRRQRFRQVRQDQRDRIGLIRAKASEQVRGAGGDIEQLGIGPIICLVCRFSLQLKGDGDVTRPLRRALFQHLIGRFQIIPIIKRRGFVSCDIFFYRHPHGRAHITLPD